MIDTINVLINAANDKNNADVMEAAEKFKGKVDRYMSNDKADKERMKKDEQEKKDYNNKTGFTIYTIDEVCLTTRLTAAPQSRPRRSFRYTTRRALYTRAL